MIMIIRSIISRTSYVFIFQIERGEDSVVGASVVVKVLPWTCESVRFVTHHDASTTDIEAVIAKLRYVIQEMDSKGT